MNVQYSVCDEFCIACEIQNFSILGAENQIFIQKKKKDLATKLISKAFRNFAA